MRNNNYYIKNLESPNETPDAREIVEFCKSKGIVFPNHLFKLTKGNLVLPKPLAMARVETEDALNLAYGLNKKLSLITFEDDGLVFCSNEKKSLIYGIDTNGNPILFPQYKTEPRRLRGDPYFGRSPQKHYSIRPEELEEMTRGKRLSKITLQDGTLLKDFHKRRLKGTLPDVLTGDVSEAFSGKNPQEYFSSYLAFFGGLGILLQNFHGGEYTSNQGNFRRDIFIPAFKEIQKELGFNPNIYKMPFHKTSNLYLH